jgi:hypothetical protein
MLHPKAISWFRIGHAISEFSRINRPQFDLIYMMGCCVPAREKQLKGWIRAKKLAFISKIEKPTWNDLSEGWYLVDPTVNKRGEPLRSS